MVNFNLTIKDLTRKICKVLKVSFNRRVIFNKNNNDKRNYNVESKNFKKLFKNFKYSSFKKDLLDLKAGINQNNIKKNNLTVRMKFYKKLF